MGFDGKICIHTYIWTHFCEAKPPVVTQMVWWTSSANTIISIGPKANISTDFYTFDRPEPFTFELVSCSRDWKQTGVKRNNQAWPKSSCGMRACSKLDSFLASYQR